MNEMAEVLKLSGLAPAFNSYLLLSNFKTLWASLVNDPVPSRQVPKGLIFKLKYYSLAQRSLLRAPGSLLRVPGSLLRARGSLLGARGLLTVHISLNSKLIGDNAELDGLSYDDRLPQDIVATVTDMELQSELLKMDTNKLTHEESSLVVDGKCSKNHAVISNEAAVHAGGSTPEARMVFSDATGHKIELASQPLTTDLTPWGRFCWLRAPMDLASSGGEFCKRGDGALQGIPGTIKEVDDILAKVEAELQAIVWGVNKCRLYLAGLGHILIISDHKPLKAICNRTSYEANKNTQIQRMLEKLCPYYFTVEWKAGSTIV
eukprot:maker-scaffold1169_size57682-snap-gene-0.9 protein:Tk06059 transcript:maker-scaffold1169_size57682-snap-gene-0.9-mRNA-1 annotation:"gag-pol fusion protein"